MDLVPNFQDEWFFLNNYCPHPVDFDGLRYPSVEHAYQAAKTLDEKTRLAIRNTADPDEAKLLGRASVHRADWDEYKLGLMEKLVAAKFADADLRRRLLDTGDALLVEGNDWGDTYWGVCDGAGDNHMGRILMEVRSRARAHDASSGIQ